MSIAGMRGSLERRGFKARIGSAAGKRHRLASASSALSQSQTGQVGAARRKVECRMKAIPKGLGRDSQVESLLSARRNELGLFLQRPLVLAVHAEPQESAAITSI